LPAKHYGAGAGERSSKDRHSHEAWDLAAADQVGLEVRLLARVAVRRVLDRFLDEERRISEPAGLAAHDRFAVLADVHGRPIGPHRPHDVNGQGRTEGLDEPAEVRIDAGGFPAGVGEDGRAGATEVGGQVAPGSH
jgi:hypothetical protein